MKIIYQALARSENYAVSHQHETVFLDRPCGPKVTIGDFYGDPEAAIIDFQEKWVIIVGCGIILYWLREPFTPYEYNRVTDQWWESHREPPDVWWIESVYQVSESIVRFVVDPYSAIAGVYDLDVESLSITRIIPEEGGSDV